MPRKSTSRTSFLAVATFVCLLIAPHQASPQETSNKKAFSTGDAVSVREGDSWSPAKIVKREGRKYQIRYDDGTEEWVTSDRIRDVAGADKTTPKLSVRNESDESEPAKPQKPAKRKKFQARDQVEIFWGASWFPGTIKKVKGTLYLVHYDKWSSHFDEWVAITRLRRPGEESDDSPLPTPAHRRGLRSDAGGGTTGRRGPVRSGDPFRQHEPDDPDRPLGVANTDAAVDLQLLSKAGAKFTPDPAAGQLSPRSIVLKGGAGGHFPHVAAVVFGRNVAFAVISEGSRKGISVIERLDLKSSRSTGTWPLLPEMSLTAVSPDGGRLLLQSDRFFHGTKGRLDIFTLEKSKPEYVTGFLPYQSLDEKSKDVRWARLLDGRHLLTVGGDLASSTLILWQIEGLKAKWTARIPAHAEPALSPGGKQLAIPLEHQIVVIDVLSGETVAVIPSEFGGGTLAFSPNGEKLAQSIGNVVVVFDIAKSASLGAMANSGRQGIPAWPDDAHVLVGETLFSVDKHCPLWVYKQSQSLPLTVAGGVTWFVDGTGRSFRLAGLPLPTSDALEAEKGIEEPSHFILRPGAKLSLDVRAGTDTPKVSEALTRQLTAIGVDVEANEPVRLRATIANGRSHELTYEVRQFGRGFDKQTMKKSVTDSVYTVAIVGPDHKVGWQASSSSGPPVAVFMQQGESADEAINRATKPSASWFFSVKIPAYVPKAEAALGMGASLLTSQGATPLPAGSLSADAAPAAPQPAPPRRGGSQSGL
ncbi:MAG TPA: agenet domain-containing protein [Planctomycetaceae bacterium]|nr:agenet domain-containing protein [Planctomycetaceae bacterium]